MQASEPSGEKIHQAYQELMVAIFAITTQDPQIPFCYPYIIEDGERVFLEEGVNQVLETLPDFPEWPKERQIQLLNLRFGLEDGRSRTLREVGRELGKTRERIRQVELRTFRVLRHPSRSKLLKRFLIPIPEGINEQGA